MGSPIWRVSPEKCFVQQEELDAFRFFFKLYLNVLTFSPLAGGCSEGLDAFRFFLKKIVYNVL